MPNFVLNVIQPDRDSPPPPEFLEPILRDVKAVNEEMRSAGAWVFRAELDLAHTARVVRVDDDGTSLTDGPYAEGKEHPGGFTVIAAPDLDAALGWAEKLSRATTLPIEVRPVTEVNPA
ncbi:YciI family protein [Micromonospora echinofusca]|uniref:YciI family protein n=1 Tax=Micromonospora echinofusca TaxID=47858 RepID=UPI000C71576B|nr:YciI family protein [Micromonospora sp. MSM11]MCL7456030.1 YciI family protein [Micromonospora sp. MSM11]